jgi:hypothetical protein
MERRPIGCRVGWLFVEQASILAHLKQVQLLPMRRALQLQDHLATKPNIFLGDGDGVPGQAAPSALLDGGRGTFEFELRLVFLLFQLQECTHMAQLTLHSARVGEGQVWLSQN